MIIKLKTETLTKDVSNSFRKKMKEYESNILKLYDKINTRKNKY